MNNRIQQLAGQANVRPLYSPAYAPRYIFEEEELEKFAELIVKECADEAKYHVMNISTYADADFVCEQIKRNFGVEE